MWCIPAVVDSDQDYWHHRAKNVALKSITNVKNVFLSSCDHKGLIRSTYTLVFYVFVAPWAMQMRYCEYEDSDLNSPVTFDKQCTSYSQTTIIFISLERVKKILAFSLFFNMVR